MSDLDKIITKARDVIGPLADEIGTVMKQVSWAEEEIARAAERHPAEKDACYHAFSLLTPTNSLMTTEFVYRSHCRELLDRLAAGEDTRLATAAEVILAISRTSHIAPLTPSTHGLAGRMWAQARFDGVANPFADMHDHYEAIRADQIDDLEAQVRRKLSVNDRKLSKIECSGHHHGEHVQCKYAETTPKRD